MIRAIFTIVFLLAMTCAGRTQTRGSESWVLKERLVRACMERDVEGVKELLKRGASPNSKDEFGQPLVVLATRNSVYGALSDTYEILKILLDAGADVNATNDFGSTALFLTSRPHPMIDIKDDPLKLLIERKANRGVKDKFGLSFEEYRDGGSGDNIPEEERLWRYLLEGNATLRDFPPKIRLYSNGATFEMAGWYYAEYYQRPSIFRGSDAIDRFGENYLFYMASRSKFFAGELSGIDRKIADTQTPEGETAMMRGAKFGSDLFVFRLLANGADPELRDRSGLSALDYAVLADSYMTVFNLLMKADASKAAADGKTALIRAIQNRSTRSVNAFIVARLFADEIEKKRQKQKTQLSDLKLAESFRRIDIDQPDRNGRTPLMYGVETGNTSIVKELLKLKPKLHLRDQGGKTASDLAKTNPQMHALLSRQ